MAQVELYNRVDRSGAAGLLQNRRATKKGSKSGGVTFHQSIDRFIEYSTVRIRARAEPILLGDAFSSGRGGEADRDIESNDG